MLYLFYVLVYILYIVVQVCILRMNRILWYYLTLYLGLLLLYLGLRLCSKYMELKNHKLFIITLLLVLVSLNIAIWVVITMVDVVIPFS